MKTIWEDELETFSATIATALVTAPTICSPIINSSVVVDAVVSEETVILGADAAPVSADS